MRKTRTINPPFSRASAGPCHSWVTSRHLKAALSCLVIFAELSGLCEVLVGSVLPLPFPQAHWSGGGCYTACCSNTKRSPGATGIFPWSDKPKSKVSCISRQKRQAAFAALEVSHLGIREESWVLWHVMTWGQPQPPGEGTPVACCAQEGNSQPSPFLWNWLNWLSCPFENFSGALHETHHLYMTLTASIRPLGSDSFSEERVVDEKDPVFFMSSLQMVQKYVSAWTS